MTAEIHDKNGMLFEGTLEAMAELMDRFISKRQAPPPKSEGDLRLLQQGEEIVRWRR